MSASESAPAASDLHTTIDQLIAEKVKQSRTASEIEKQQLSKALQSALEEIDASQQALARAASVLQAALGTAPADTETATAEIPTPVIKEAAPEEAAEVPLPEPDQARGEHELDVIAHHANIGNASGLQSMLRSRSEVKSAQTREFVNGELRLQVHLRNGLDMDAFSAWLKEHNAALVTATDSVIEVRFAS